MNTAKNAVYTKLIAFFLIIAALLSVLVISANGSQADDSPTTDGSSDASTDNNDGGANNETDLPNEPTEPDPPKFYHHLTGVEVSEEAFGDSQVAYVIDANSPLCGISQCNILIEFPIENEKSRYIMLTDKSTEITKIGSITYSRYFMSNLAYAFGASVVSLGNDDTVNYNHVDTDLYMVSLTKNPGTYYTEYTYFTYTGTELISSAQIAFPKNLTTLPYSFKNETDSDLGSITAERIDIPYESKTALVYQKDQNEYCLNKMGSDRIDVSTSGSVAFTNVLILFADSMTYETTDKTEMVVNTIGSGSGYYAYGGKAEEITWSLDINGNLSFFNKSGEKLDIGRGSTYISYVKSSRSKDVIFS